MKRKKFIKSLLAASTLITMDGFSHLIHAMQPYNKDKPKLTDFATYGPIHLNNTSIQRSTEFWTKVVGMKLRFTKKNLAEFGTENKTLVVVHQTAKTGFKKGYSGLYHFAIHAPNITAFASMIHRLDVNKYAYTPIDHTMSKSIYLDDPDGINIEFTLETPERFKRVVTSRGLKIEGTDGVIRSASERFNVKEVLNALEGIQVPKIIAKDAYIGHVHLYANNVQDSNAFFKKMGFEQFNYLPELLYADLGAGGKYKHRIVMNSWHGTNIPLAPLGSAGLKHFQINYNNEEKFCEALGNLSNVEEKDGGYWFKDPTGNQIVMTNIN